MTCFNLFRKNALLSRSSTVDYDTNGKKMNMNLPSFFTRHTKLIYNPVLGCLINVHHWVHHTMICALTHRDVNNLLHFTVQSTFLVISCCFKNKPYIFTFVFFFVWFRMSQKKSTHYIRKIVVKVGRKSLYFCHQDFLLHCHICLIFV